MKATPKQQTAVGLAKSDLIPAVIKHTPRKEVREKMASALTAVAFNQPELIQTAQDCLSLIPPLTRLVQLGLVPDGNEAVIVKYDGKPTAVPMAAGIKRAIESLPGVSHCETQVAYDKDDIVYEPLTGKPPEIRIKSENVFKRGNIVGVIGVAVMEDGRAVSELISVADIKAKYKQPNYATKWFEEWIRNVALKKLWKRLPQATAITPDVWDAAEKDAGADEIIIEAADTTEQPATEDKKPAAPAPKTKDKKPAEKNGKDKDEKTPKSKPTKPASLEDM